MKEMIAKDWGRPRTTIDGGGGHRRQSQSPTVGRCSGNRKGCCNSGDLGLDRGGGLGIW